MEPNDEELKKEIENDLRTNPKYLDFYNQYSPSSIKRFIEYYTQKKFLWVKYGEVYVTINENRTMKYKNIASELLFQIQQVKLFDMQCFWRAEQIEIPGVSIIQDFITWESNIENCPFLTPISEDEFELFKEYANSSDAEIPIGDFLDTFDDWQDYDEIKRSFVNDDDGYVTAPEWYLFYYNRRGGAPCAYLPDIRGEKEDFYLSLRREHDLPLSQKPLPQPVETRPYFPFYIDENLLEFVNLFEDRKIKEYADAMVNCKDAEHDEDLLEAITTLKYADQPVEIVSENIPWRDALMKTVELYERQQVIIELDGAYRSYLQRIKLGIPFESKHDLAFFQSLVDMKKDFILEGRRLNNEPEDLNF